MSGKSQDVEALLGQKYRHGFVTDIESDSLPPGLDEGVVEAISRIKGEPRFLLDWRLKAYRHWLTMREPAWARVHYKPIDYQDISYYSAPKAPANAPKSLDEVDPKLLATYAKLGIPLHERARLAGVAVDAVFDSVSVATTFKDKLSKAGVIFCSFSDAVRNHPELIERYLGTVVPAGDNYFAALNSAVFSDGSFVYVPPGVRCPMELSTYFRINAAKTGQFERTLIVAAEGASVSYLEGCTAPMRDENQLHAAVVELVAEADATIKYSTVQNWYPGDERGVGGIYKNAEREKKYDYSEQIFVERLVVFFNKSNPLNYTKLEDLHGKRVGVLKGWSYGDDFDKAKKGGAITCEEADADSQNFQKMDQHHLDATVAVFESGTALLPKYKSIAYAATALSRNPTYLTFAKSAGKAALIKQFDQAMKDLKASGELQKIVQAELAR